MPPAERTGKRGWPAKNNHIMLNEMLMMQTANMQLICWKNDKIYGSKGIQPYITKNGESYTIPQKSNTKELWECK